MFKYVHHVHYVVRNRDEMVAYIERNFGMKPEKLEYHEPRGLKDAFYCVGQTKIEITEPTKPGVGPYRFLEQHGPGVYHVGWAVDNIEQAAKDLIARGNTLKGEGGTFQGPHRVPRMGYDILDIDTKDSLGLWFQLVEEPSN